MSESDSSIDSDQENENLLLNDRDNYNEPLREDEKVRDTVEESNEPFDDPKKEEEQLQQDIKDTILQLESFFAPIILTILSAFVRLYNIGKSDVVVWDEAHFGKFGSYYLKHEFYFDVHPPLGKLLIGLSGYLAGFDGSFEFESGVKYPHNVNFVYMRIFQSIFSILCVPVAYYTSKQLKFSILTTWLISIMICFETTYITLSKFIVLDSMLLFFTFTTFYCMVRIHNIIQQNEILSLKWWFWMFLSGLNIGFVCSIKWVGLFITIVFGIQTILNLWNLYCDKKIGNFKYLFHFWVRVFFLIIIPFIVYYISFKIHFAVLYKSGTGDSNTSTLFQANLQNGSIVTGPRTVAIGSLVTIKSQGLSPGLLHSHDHFYPTGSNQQQVTTYSYKDDNNIWIFDYPRTIETLDIYGDEKQHLYNENDPILYLQDGDLIRLKHNFTNVSLHTHDIKAPVSRKLYEVSGYGNDSIGNLYDNWIIEIVDQVSHPDLKLKENENELHPLTTSFRLKNPKLNCYLSTTGISLPKWGFDQGEVVCKKSWNKKDKLTWWNIEDHKNSKLPDPPKNWKPPKSKFFKDFILLNLGMMASNNALIPDPDKRDDLASEAWEWPIVYKGIRIISWDPTSVKYYLLGNPAIEWPTTIGILTFIIYSMTLIILWQRQIITLSNDDWSQYIIGGIFPLLCWIFHYFPFILMSRVTYVHHYMPAVYFAILLFGYQIDQLNKYLVKTTGGKIISLILYIGCFYGIIETFRILSPICFGMIGDSENYSYLNWLNSWQIV